VPTGPTPCGGAFLFSPHAAAMKIPAKLAPEQFVYFAGILRYNVVIYVTTLREGIYA
jgi:hypothetical protein